MREHTLIRIRSSPTEVLALDIEACRTAERHFDAGAECH